MTAIIDEACAVSGRKEIKVCPEHEDVDETHGLQPGDMAIDIALRTDNLNVSDFSSLEIISYNVITL